MPETEPAQSWRAALAYGAGAALVAVFSYVTASLVPFLKETYCGRCRPCRQERSGEEAV